MKTRPTHAHARKLESMGLVSTSHVAALQCSSKLGAIALLCYIDDLNRSRCSNDLHCLRTLSARNTELQDDSDHRVWLDMLDSRPGPAPSYPDLVSHVIAPLGANQWRVLPQLCLALQRVY